VRYAKNEKTGGQAVKDTAKGAAGLGVSAGLGVAAAHAVAGSALALGTTVLVPVAAGVGAGYAVMKMWSKVFFKNDKPAKKAKPAAKKAKPAAKAPKKPAKKAAKSKAEAPKKPARTPLKQTRGLYPCYIGTRQAAMVDMLTRKDGATCKEIAAELGWLAGSVRTAFDLDMRKKGYTVEPTGEKRDGCKVYRIKVKPLPHIPMTAE